MRDLVRNQQTVYYSLYIDDGSKRDSLGNPIGYYAEPESIKLCVSANQGEADARAFGTSLNYDRTITVTNPSVMFDEHTRLWIDGRNPEQTHNAIIKKVAPLINVVKYAIEMVSVS